MSGSHNTEILVDRANIVLWCKVSLHDELYRHLCPSDLWRSSDHYRHQYLGWTNKITSTQWWRVTTQERRPSQSPWFYAASIFDPPVTSCARLCTHLSAHIVFKHDLVHAYNTHMCEQKLVSMICLASCLATFLLFLGIRHIFRHQLNGSKPDFCGKQCVSGIQNHCIDMRKRRSRCRADSQVDNSLFLYTFVICKKWTSLVCGSLV